MIDKKIAYISYDGMLEPLGHSQVLNYLKLLSKEFSFDSIISVKVKNENLIFTQYPKRNKINKSRQLKGRKKTAKMT